MPRTIAPRSLRPIEPPAAAVRARGVEPAASVRAPAAAISADEAEARRGEVQARVGPTIEAGRDRQASTSAWNPRGPLALRLEEGGASAAPAAGDDAAPRAARAKRPRLRVADAIRRSSIGRKGATLAVVGVALASAGCATTTGSGAAGAGADLARSPAAAAQPVRSAPGAPPGVSVASHESVAAPDAGALDGLGVGDRAARVKTAEAILKRAGYAPGSIDRTLSTRTEAALAQFQRAVGLEATGRLDDETFAKLRSVDQRMKRHAGSIGVGQQGPLVRQAKERLAKLGYDVGAMGPVFDADMARAVRAFKADQDDIRGSSSLLGARGQQILRAESNALAHDPFRVRRKKSEQQRRLDARAASAAARRNDDGTRGFGEGSRGLSVAVVQGRLKAAGFDPKRRDGVFDERTAGALRAFQRRAGIEVTGRVDPTTWRHLDRVRIEATSATSPPQRIGERSGAVRETERLLRDVGISPGRVDGRYTEATERAVDRFRRAFRVGGTSNGVGTTTLRALRREAREARGVTVGELTRIMPGLSRARARALLKPLNAAMREFDIDTPKRRAAFLAQIGHESVSLRYFEEIWGPTTAQLGYEGRADLGNTRRGDGYRYRGRGPIQITGRANYRFYGGLLDVPLERKPWLASRPKTGFRIAGLYWQRQGLNALADRRDIVEITRRINGGTNGLDDRIARYGLAKQVLGV